MEGSEDWRLQGQEDYLLGRTLRWARWWSYREGWDHDHCEFCFHKFADSVYDAGDGRQTVTEGYVSADDNYHWICAACFTDFRERFGWTVVDAPGEPPN